MSTIEKAIQKQRKLSNEIEQTFNTTESHSNQSFFDEEHSQTFSESDFTEESQDCWELSSINTDNSSNPNFIPPQTSSQHSQQLHNSSPVRRAGIDQEFEVVCKDNSKKSQTGKGIATHVHGQGSIGTINKKIKKQKKSIIQQQQQQQQQSNNSSSSSSQQSKIISQNSKVMLAYLMMEQEIEKLAQQRATNFIEKYMPSRQAYEMIVETYKILLIPEPTLQQLAKVLTVQQRQLHLSLSLRRLSLQNNKHPLAAKAADKIGKYLTIDY